MDAQELRNLQEAYMEVVENQQLDEISDRKVKGMLRKRDAQDVDSGGISGAWMARRRAHQAAARRNVRTGSNVRVDSDLAKEEVDIYDIILSHLLDEGYAETPEAAEAIMVNMSEEWKENIMEISDRMVNAVKKARVKRTDRSLMRGDGNNFAGNVDKETRMNARIQARNQRTGSNVEPSFTRRHQ